MIIKTGIDLIEIGRIRSVLDRYGLRFLERIFSGEEIEQAAGKAESIAAGFAAKEAVVKALGTGIGPVSWLDVETLHHRSGEPYLRLTGRAKQVAEALGLSQWAISLTHTREYAAAVVVAAGE